MPKVFIVSGSAHDFSPAKKFGRLVVLSEGPINRYSVNNIHRQFYSILQHSKEDDYILVCGLSIMNAIASSIMAALHGRINFLLFRQGDYLERNIILKEEGDKNDSKP